MPNTRTNWTHDTGFADGKITVQPSEFMNAGAVGVITRNAVNDWSMNVAASLTGTFGISVAKILERLGQPLNLQEEFGGQGNFTGPNAAQSQPQGNPGAPPFAGVTAFLPAQVGNIPKGFKLTDVTLAYQIGTANLTSHTIGISKVAYVDNQTIVAGTTVILATAANGLSLVQRANQYVTKVAVPAPAFNVTDNSDIIIEVAAVTPATSTYRLYRAILHGIFNYN